MAAASISRTIISGFAALGRNFKAERRLSRRHVDLMSKGNANGLERSETY